MGFEIPQGLRGPTGNPQLVQGGFSHLNFLFFFKLRELPEEGKALEKLIFWESPEPGGTCIEKGIKTPLLKPEMGEGIPKGQHNSRFGWG